MLVCSNTSYVYIAILVGTVGHVHNASADNDIPNTELLRWIFKSCLQLGYMSWCHIIFQPL